MTVTKQEPDLAVFRARLRLAMRRKHITQGKLADQIGVSRATVNRWLRAGTDYFPNSYQSFGLGDLLGVSPRWLWGVTDLERMPEFLTDNEAALLCAYRTMSKDDASMLLEALIAGNRAIAKAKKKAPA